jgi:hypothetical protein
MSEARLTDALARLDTHKNLNLPPRSRDLLGRLVVRFLWRRELKSQVDVNLATRDAVDSLLEITRTQQSAMDRLAGGDQVRGELDELRRNDQNLLAGLNQRLYSAVGGLRTELSDLRLHLAEKAEHNEDVRARLADIEERLATLATAARDVRLRHAQVDLVLDQLRPALAEPDRPAVEVPARVALLEVAMVELLDGPAEQVRTARSAYLPVIEKARAAGASGPVFEVAPARGDWLDVLRANEIPARAASANPVVVRRCTESGHPVTAADPLDTLAEVDGRPLGAITAFRYVERLTPDRLARFVDLAARALQPGGVLIVETPHPAGALTGDFHLDPFARQPVHPMFLRFLVEAAGFAGVEIRYPDAGPFSGWPADITASAAHGDDRYCLLARM